MASELIKQNYRDIADAIRTKTGSSESMTATEMPEKIASIETGITPTGTLSITANGEYDVTEKAGVDVNVPIPEGYIKPTGTIGITSNGSSINVKQYEFANVNVTSDDYLIIEPYFFKGQDNIDTSLDLGGDFPMVYTSLLTKIRLEDEPQRVDYIMHAVASNEETPQDFIDNYINTWDDLEPNICWYYEGTKENNAYVAIKMFLVSNTTMSLEDSYWAPQIWVACPGASFNESDFRNALSSNFPGGVKMLDYENNAVATFNWEDIYITISEDC